MVKNPPANAADAGEDNLNPGLGGSPGEGNGSLLQYSCLDSFMDRGAWQAAGHGVTKRQTQLSTYTTVLTATGKKMNVINSPCTQNFRQNESQT